ncbi:hypothetical protein SAMN05444722_3051 [Rhodovulum sp. ES.010]|uniref:hypothetical protein n=1 Tax=Rhodovulum sp. ES.010 TaxID=1882821 RepID=UPI00092C8918|nr:hypothetical protein [Rhodovulum sp. ES.010]SIO52284.1 hypothetical protein SAMN05444722_3051 [Rhodovulum sp. ES.010]
MPDRLPTPGPAKAIFAIAILINIVVVTGLWRAPTAILLMLFANIFACGAIYWIIVRHFFHRFPGQPDDAQSPSRKSRPISE